MRQLWIPAEASAASRALTAAPLNGFRKSMWLT
jgi:hypothetical protein